MKTQIYGLILGGLIMATACTNGSQKKPETEVEETVDMAQEPSNTLTTYIKLKNSLVSSDVEAVQEAAQGLEKALLAENRNTEMAGLAGVIASEDDLEQQRVSFKTLSEQLITVLKGTDLEQRIYVQYCPMAFDNTGATWVSLSKDIENPYFGDQMLHCGSVQEEL